MTDLTEDQKRDFEAAAFRRLLEHLRERSDVQNIDLMNLAGFCRNCLSNWYRDAAEADRRRHSARTSRARSSTACPMPSGRPSTSARPRPHKKAAFEAEPAEGPLSRQTPSAGDRTSALDPRSAVGHRTARPAAPRVAAQHNRIRETDHGRRRHRNQPDRCRRPAARLHRARRDASRKKSRPSPTTSRKSLPR